MTDPKQVRLTRLKTAITVDPSIPSFFAEEHWHQIREDIVERGREEEFLAECRSIYADGDRTNGDHRDRPDGYGDLEDPEELF